MATNHSFIAAEKLLLLPSIEPTPAEVSATWMYKYVQTHGANAPLLTLLLIVVLVVLQKPRTVTDYKFYSLVATCTTFAAIHFGNVWILQTQGPIWNILLGQISSIFLSVYTRLIWVIGVFCFFILEMIITPLASWPMFLGFASIGALSIEVIQQHKDRFYQTNYFGKIIVLLILSDLAVVIFRYLV